MTTSSQDQLKDQLQNLHAHLLLIKTMKETDKENEFYVLLEKAQKILGDVSPYIAIFYYNYGNFLLSKIEANMDLFNQGAIPEGQDEDAIEEYEECYEDDSLDYQNGANNDNEQKKQVTHHDEQKKETTQQENPQKPSNEQTDSKEKQKVVYENDYMQITQIDQKLKEKLQENPNFLQNQNQIPNDEEEDINDLEVCYENFQAALTIYNRELKKMDDGEGSPLDKTETLKYRFHIHGRLGELYALDQKYEESVEEFRQVIKYASEFDNPETLRNISEAHFSIGNALLHQGKSSAETLAIQEYISAVKCLIKYIQDVQNYDTSKFEVPSLEKPKVDRYQYLRAPRDSDKVADLKEVISMILDKIEDTHEQIGVKSLYEAEKRKMEKEKQESVFKEVPKDVKVTNLGTFGSRKRTPSTNEVKPQGAQGGAVKSAAILTGLNPNAPSEALRRMQVGNKQGDQVNNQDSGSKSEGIKTETQVKEKNENTDVKVVKNVQNEEKIEAEGGEK